MKSIKPGRGPSLMNGIGNIFAALFGVAWIIIAVSIGGGFFAIFGVIFIAVAIVNAVYNFKNATSENRYSAFDITDETEEPDPFNERFGHSANKENADFNTESNFCPYCGARVSKTYEFCNKCGNKLP